MSIRMMTLPPLSPTAAERTKAIIADYRTAPMIEFAIKAAYREGASAVLALLGEPSEELIEAMAAARYQVPVEWSHDQRTTNYWSGASGTVRQNERNGMRDALRAAAAHLGEDKP